MVLAGHDFFVKGTIDLNRSKHRPPNHTHDQKAAKGDAGKYAKATAN